MAAVLDNSAFLENNPRLLARLKLCSNLPTLPGIAMQVIDLAKDPTTDVGRVADVVSLDPALTTKIFRVANSALYARQRKTANLRQAIILFGLNGVLTLALSFSLMSALRAREGGGLDYNRFWRRSLASALACRALGKHCKGASREDLFLAGLLQDIGMLVIDQLEPQIYETLGEHQVDHAQVQMVERDTLGVDHAEVGAWLLESWNLPPHLVHGIAASHDSQMPAAEFENVHLVRCVAVGGKVAEIWLGEDPGQVSLESVDVANELLQMDRETLGKVVAEVGAEFEEHAGLFEIDLGDEALMESITERAQEVMMLRTLQSLHRADELHQTAESLESRTRELEEQARRDGLTELYNRRHLDQVLEEEFVSAKRHGWPLAVLFIDLDHFKRVNDKYGHQAGDKVLQRAAQILTDSSRDSDLVARYGGEEFVLLLPGTEAAGAIVTCERIIKAFRETTHTVGEGESVTVTASIGIAIQGKNSDFGHYEDLMPILVSAKRHGWPLAVLFIDLDHFKRVNDKYGHQAGDKVLQRAAQILTDSSRDSDLVARYGGEEFVLLLPGTEAAGAIVTCERIIKAFRETTHTVGEGESVTVTASIGIAIQGKNADFGHYEDLMQAADSQVYAAKQQGRDRWLMLEPESP